jgi:hypothetical protein
MSIDSQMSADAFATVHAALAAADAEPTRASRKRAVLRSAEFERVKALPYRDAEAYGPALVDALSDVFARTPGVRLLPAQAIALYEIEAFGGFIGNITMGGGKTLISLLACSGHRGLIVMPAKLIPKTRLEMAAYARHWKVPGNITIISYEKLSRVNYATFLEELAPTRIICDEGHRLKSKKTGAHRRIHRYLKKSKASFVVFSGTLIGESLHGWAPLADWALHTRSPAPTTYSAQTEWQSALSREGVIQPGALLDFGDDFREGYRARLESAPGCYVTKGSGISNALEIERFETTLPPILRACIAHLEEKWELPTGETITDPLSFHRAMRQLELGCYYRWRTPAPQPWREARLLWAQTVREVIKYSRHLDTELAVINAVDRGGVKKEAIAALAEWRAVKHSFEPDTECIWVDPSPVKEIAARARDGEPSLVWAYHGEVGAAFQREGLPYYGAGGLNTSGGFIETATGAHSVALSITSNAEGRNLQKAFARSIVAELPRDPVILEQLVARTHRIGQPRDVVSVEVNTSTDASKRAWLRVLDRSAHIQKVSGQGQRLLNATHVNPLTDEEKEQLGE